MTFSRSKTYTVEGARAAIQRYCAFQERCQSEVEERLRTMGVLPEVQADLVGELVAEGFVNEERFARAYARGKFRMKGWGPRKIAQGLHAKRVPSGCIELGLSELDPQDVRDYLKRQSEKLADRTALWAWAYRKGYERGDVAAVLNAED